MNVGAEHGGRVEAAPVIASDLDRTLIYSPAASALGGGALPSLVCVELLDGEPLSFMTAATVSLLASLAEVAVFVPTTTRTLAQLARVQLSGVDHPGKHGGQVAGAQVPPRPTSYAVAANGGHLVVDGVPDRDWSAEVTRTLAETATSIDEVWARLAAVCRPSWALKLRRADELFCYAVIDRAAMPADFLVEITAWCTERGWVTSLQGRKLYFVPARLTKSAAVGEVVRRVGASGFVAAGDSLLDAELLAAAVAGIRPAHGELFDLGWSAPHIRLTRDAGVRAGEQIAAWLLSVAGQPGQGSLGEVSSSEHAARSQSPVPG